MHPKKTTFLLLVQMGLVACTMIPASSGDRSPQEFTVARIVLEQNFTDQDAEVVITAKGMDEGLKKLMITGPGGVQVVSLSAGTSTLGVRELSIESPEPGLLEVLQAYPEGVYSFEGVTISGAQLQGTAILSHEMPPPTTIRVDKVGGTINWSAVPDIDHYVIELELEAEGKDVVKLSLDAPSDMTSFRIPVSMRGPGAYQVGISGVSSGGNLTVVEVEFTIDG